MNLILNKINNINNLKIINTNIKKKIFIPLEKCQIIFNLKNQNTFSEIVHF